MVVPAGCLAALGLLVAASPSTAAPPLLWERCHTGSAASECQQPRGIAADPDNGHVFVADNFNNRVVEFDALGNFIKAWGWDVVASGPGNSGTGFEICVTEAGDVCKQGVPGGGAGQLNGAQGVAVDSTGDIYIGEWGNRRVQKFDSKGNFLSMFGGTVNKTKTEEPGSTEAERNRCPVDPGDVCQAGSLGTGQGQFGNLAVGDFIAVDSFDRVYVGDQSRLQRFDAAGAYQDECSVPATVQSLALDASGTIYAAYASQVDVRKLAFAAGGECLESARLKIPKPDEFTTRSATAVSVDAAGHVYVFANPATGNGFIPIDRIFEFDSTGNIVDQFGKGEFNSSTGLAVNLCPGSEPPGNLYVSNFNVGSANSFVRAYGTEPIGCFKALTKPASNIAESSATLNGTVTPDGTLTSECRFEWGTTTAYGSVAPCVETPAEIGEGTEPVPVHADVSGLTGATIYHFRLRAKIGGQTETGPDKQLKTLGPPTIGDEHVVAATDDEAAVKALVNPEGLPTSCVVEYGLTDAYGQSTVSQSVGTDRNDHVVSVFLHGLQPGVPYHWRFVCSNGAILNGGLTEGVDRTLTTYRPFTTETGCPNDAFRTDASALLPDCRAYEMVSPVDKNGADIFAAPKGEAGPAIIVQAGPEGDRIAYGTTGSPAFGEDAPNSFIVNQYLANRSGSGWSSQGIHPPFLGEAIEDLGTGAFRHFTAFTPDLCSAWVLDEQTPPLNPDGQLGAMNLYRRQNCAPGEGSFETLTTAPLPADENPATADADPTKYVDARSVQGFSTGADHAIFAANAQLTEDAATGIHAQLYDRFGGGLHLVSVLPGGAAAETSSVVGSGPKFNLENAVAADGSAAYWTSGMEVASGRGKIYLRSNPGQGKVEGECTEPAKACTTVVSAGANAFFWVGARDGSAALYTEGSALASEADLFRFDATTKASQLLVADTMGVAGASQDLSRVYFISRKAIAGAGENSYEEEASDGAPNLYLSEPGGFRFIATLVEGDVGAREPGAGAIAYSLVNFDENTFRRATRVTPSGSHLAFQTRAPIGEFDNATADGGKLAVEVYLYEAGGELICASCNPGGARPAARTLPEPYGRPGKGRKTDVVAAAWIPTWEHPHHASNLLAEDGRRLFFNANDALVPHDTNGTQDVYEWEALGRGGCDGEDSSFFPQRQGCISLISSGQSPFESTFWEASPDGEDVFFTTAAGLLPQDPGSIDLYDARVGGGFPQPPPAVECEGEACQSPPPAPTPSVPSSSTYHGLGNVEEAARRPRCPKGKRRVRRAGKVRCVKKEKRRGGHRRRAAR